MRAPTPLVQPPRGSFAGNRSATKQAEVQAQPPAASCAFFRRNHGANEKWILTEVRLMRAGVVLLAAGRSSRMGTQKLLLPWGRSTVVGCALDAALTAGAEQVVVVTGCDAARVEEACRAVTRGRRVDFIHNPDWASGMLSSIRSGTGCLDPLLDGFAVALGDMPLIPPDLYGRLIGLFGDAPDRYVLPVFRPGRQPGGLPGPGYPGAVRRGKAWPGFDRKEGVRVARAPSFHVRHERLGRGDEWHFSQLPSCQGMLGYWQVDRRLRPTDIQAD